MFQGRARATERGPQGNAPGMQMQAEVRAASILYMSKCFLPSLEHQYHTPQATKPHDEGFYLQFIQQPNTTQELNLGISRNPVKT